MMAFCLEKFVKGYHLTMIRRWELHLDVLKRLRANGVSLEACSSTQGVLNLEKFGRQSTGNHPKSKVWVQKVKKIGKNRKYQFFQNILLIPFRRVERTLRCVQSHNIKSFPLVKFSNGGMGFSVTQWYTSLEGAVSTFY